MCEGEGREGGHGISRSIEKRACGNSRSIKKRSGISGGVHKKIMWNFQGSWVLTLEFPKGVTQFYRISRGESLLKDSNSIDLLPCKRFAVMLNLSLTLSNITNVYEVY